MLTIKNIQKIYKKDPRNSSKFNIITYVSIYIYILYIYYIHTIHNNTIIIHTPYKQNRLAAFRTSIQQSEDKTETAVQPLQAYRKSSRYTVHRRFLRSSRHTVHTNTACKPMQD